MKTRLIAAVTALAVALSGLAVTPAVALNQKEQRALALILGAVALGVIINNEDKKRSQPKPVPVRRWQPQPGQQPPYHRGRGDDRWRNRTIPAECVYDVRTGSGRRQVVSKTCLSEFDFDRGLPAECAFEIRTERGRREVYGPRCLQEFGYRIEDVRY